MSHFLVGGEVLRVEAEGEAEPIEGREIRQVGDRSGHRSRFTPSDSDVDHVIGACVDPAVGRSGDANRERPSFPSDFETVECPLDLSRNGDANDHAAIRQSPGKVSELERLDRLDPGPAPLLDCESGCHPCV